MDSIYQIIPGVSPKRSLYISYERKLSNPSATLDVEARKVRVPTAYMMLEKSKGNLDHCSRGFRQKQQRRTPSVHRRFLAGNKEPLVATRETGLNNGTYKVLLRSGPQDPSNRQ